MKKLSAILGYCLLVSSCLFAQYSTDWVRPADNYLKTGAMIARDNLDNVVVTGYIQNQNIYTRKYDKQGNFLWERTDSSGIHSNYEKPLWVNTDNSNNIFVAGYRYALGSSREYPVAVVVLKYSASGVLLWKQTMNISVLVGTSHAVFNLRSEVDSNGNLYIGTAANSPSGFIFYKLSPEGTILVNTSINFNDINGFNSMRLKGNKVILTGGSYDRSAATVVAWDTAGTLLWTNSFLGLSGSDIEIDENGNSYLLSTYSNQVSGSSGFDIEVYKLNSSGAQLWKRNFDFGGQELSTRFSLVADRLSVIARGTLSPSLYTDWITFQLNSAGTLLWDARYNGTQHNDEKSYFLTSKPNGDVFVTGVSRKMKVKTRARPVVRENKSEERIFPPPFHSLYHCTSSLERSLHFFTTSGKMVAEWTDGGIGREKNPDFYAAGYGSINSVHRYRMQKPESTRSTGSGKPNYGTGNR